VGADGRRRAGADGSVDGAPPFPATDQATLMAGARAVPGGRDAAGGVGAGGRRRASYVAQDSRIVSALEDSNEHIAQHYELNRIGTDAG
jgi:hypothetical protein